MFIEARPLSRVAYAFVGGGHFSNTQVGIRSGKVKRNANRSMPLHRYRAPYKNVKPEHYQDVVNAYFACGGSLNGFRFHDPFDGLLDDVIIGTAVGGAGEEMQIVKPYTFGPTGGEVTLNRIIKKPVNPIKFPGATPIAVTADDVPIGYTLNFTTGILTISVTGGEIIRVTCDYDIPVFFEDDDLDFSYETWNAISAEIIIKEDFTA